MSDTVKKVIDSPNVMDYKLPAALKKVFAEFDALNNYTVIVCGKEALRFVRLPKNLYSDLCDVIVRKSDRRRNIHTVNYHGLCIINATDPTP